jgi:hypothetical protein
MIHPNEVTLTPQNLPLLLTEAHDLSPAHERALKEQMARQAQVVS